MEHQFNIEVAKVVGVNAAVIYQNIKFWCLKNKANNAHFHDGNYWTYNSNNSFCQLFPYLTESQIKTAIKKLVDNGFVGVGNYNTNPYDHTNWYSDLKPIDWIKIANRSDDNIQRLDKNRQCITDSKHTDTKYTDINTDSNFSADAEQKKIEVDFEKVWYSFRGKRNSLESDFKKFLKKSEGVEVDFENLHHLSKKVNNVYFQTWLNDVLPKAKQFGKSEFRKYLLDAGVDPQHADDWIKVRTTKRAAFTLTVLESLFNECEKNNFQIKEAVRICAEQSWQGFKFSWVKNLENNGKQTGITASQDRQERIDSVKRMGSLARQIVANAINNGSSSN